MTWGPLYENASLRELMGDTLRPGGFFLTERALEFCKIKEGARALDLGCGLGASVNYLQGKWAIKALGLDPSGELIRLGRDKYGVDLVQGLGEDLPFEAGSFDLVLAECSLSLMTDHRRVLGQVSRVVKAGGFFIVSDVYAKHSQYLDNLRQIKIETCLRNLFHLKLLEKEMGEAGFKLVLLEDWSSLLQQVLVEIIFKYGSMKEFWNITSCGACGDFSQRLRQCKPGYFLMIGVKE